jgi:hypothetical protein
MAELRKPPDTPTLLDYQLSPRPRQPPTRFQILAAWIVPIGVQAIFNFAAPMPLVPLTSFWIRSRNFFRSIVAIPTTLLFSLRMTDPNGLQTHAVMAAIIWPILLAVVTLTPIRRLPLIIHVILSVAWTMSGCCFCLMD